MPTRRSLGFSLIEVIIAMCLIAIMSMGSAIYYNDLVNKTRVDKAQSELQQLKKIFLQLESSLESPLTTYGEISQDVHLRDIRKLVEHRLTADVPLDPWNNDYRIDLEAGIIYSAGPNGEFDYDRARWDLDGPMLPMEAALLARRDDVVVRYKAKFSVDLAKMGPARSLVEVDFSRAVDGTTVRTECFVITPAPPISLTTAYTDLMNRYKARLRLSGDLPVGNWNMTVTTSVRAFDGATLSAPVLLEIRQQ